MHSEFAINLVLPHLAQSLLLLNVTMPLLSTRPQYSVDRHTAAFCGGSCSTAAQPKPLLAATTSADLPLFLSSPATPNGSLLLHLVSGLACSVDDILITSASTQHAIKCVIDLSIGWVGIGAQQPVKRDEKPGSAETALQRVIVLEGLLQGMQVFTFHQHFDGLDLDVLCLDSQDQAGSHRITIHEHGTDATNAELAGHFGSGQLEIIA